MSGPPSLRVLTWNIRHMFGDPLAVRRVLRAAAPDIVCLQEAPRVPWSAWSLQSVARDSGLIFAAGGWAGAATAILRSPRVHVHDARAVRFPRPTVRSHRRGATLVTVGLADQDQDADGSPVQVASVHLGLDAAERLDHVEQLVRLLAEAQLPVAVAGDLNERPGGPAWTAFSTIVTDPKPTAGATFSVTRPRWRLDAVLTSPSVTTLEYGQWQPDHRDAELASDHLPVLSVIRF